MPLDMVSFDIAHEGPRTCGQYTIELNPFDRSIPWTTQEHMISVILYAAW